MKDQEKEKIFTEVTTMAKETKEPAPDKEALFAFLDQPKLGSNVQAGIQKINKAIASRIAQGLPNAPEGIKAPDPGDLADVQIASERESATKSLDSAIENAAVSRAVEKISAIAGKAAEAKTPAKAEAKAAHAAPVKSNGGMTI